MAADSGFPSGTPGSASEAQHGYIGRSAHPCSSAAVGTEQCPTQNLPLEVLPTVPQVPPNSAAGLTRGQGKKSLKMGFRKKAVHGGHH